MTSLEIKTSIYSSVTLNVLDEDNELEIDAQDCNGSASAWINKDQAIKIINHLKEQFEL